MCNLPTQLSPQDQSPWLTQTRPRHGGQSLGLLGLYISNASRLPLSILRRDRSTNLVLGIQTETPPPSPRRKSHVVQHTQRVITHVTRHHERIDDERQMALLLTTLVSDHDRCDDDNTPLLPHPLIPPNPYFDYFSSLGVNRLSNH